MDAAPFAFSIILSRPARFDQPSFWCLHRVFACGVPRGIAAPRSSMSTNQQTGAGANPVASQPVSGAQQTDPAAVSSGGKVDLTALPEFRKFQSENDRTLAQMRQQLADAQRALDEIRRADEQKALADADKLPMDEANALLKGQLKTMLEKQTAQSQASMYYEQAVGAVKAAGLDPNDPRLADAWRVGPSADGVAAVSRRVAELAAEDLRALRAQLEAAKSGTQSQVTQAAQVATVNALAQSGVLATSNGGGSAVAPTNEDARLADFKARYARMRHQVNDDNAISRLTTDLRNAGLTLADLT